MYTHLANVSLMYTRTQTRRASSWTQYMYPLTTRYTCILSQHAIHVSSHNTLYMYPHTHTRTQTRRAISWTHTYRSPRRRQEYILWWTRRSYLTTAPPPETAVTAVTDVTARSPMTLRPLQKERERKREREKERERKRERAMRVCVCLGLVPSPPLSPPPLPSLSSLSLCTIGKGSPHRRTATTN